jgi:hypothetical protein
MERSREHDDLATALAEVRPAPRQTFTEELDERAAAGFPRRSWLDGTALAGLVEQLRGLAPQRLLFAGGIGALAAIAIATVRVTNLNSGSGPVALDSRPQNAATRSQESSAVGSEKVPATPSGSGSSGVQFSDSVPLAKPGAEFLTAARHREIERSAEIALLAEPADVAEDSTKVFAAVHDADGIVLRSTTSSGENAGAHFNLLIASAKLGDALAALSAIDEVRSRHEATDDITAPTVSAREELRDSGARIDALLAQLSATETESEADAVETELRERLASLDRRTTYSRVSVRIESGASADSGGTWGFDDAIGDAGRILAVAAGVTLVGLAIIAPLALIAFLAWFARRSWLRRARDRALA